MKVLVTEAEAYNEMLRSHFPQDWLVIFENIDTQQQLTDLVKDCFYDIIIAKLGIYFGREFFLQQQHLQILATPTTGLDHIDLVAAAEAGVHIVSLRGEKDFLSRITSTAEHAWALLLQTNRSLATASSRVSDGRWDRRGLDVHELSESTLGIIGLGRLGRIVARYGLAFGMQVVACDPNVPKDNFPSGVHRVALEELLERSNAIVLLASYNSGDPPILGQQEFRSIKPDTVFVNVARGKLVDEEALLQAFDSGQIRGIGLDVLNNDSAWQPGLPLPQNELIRRAKSDERIVITPHMGGYAVEAVRKTRKFLIDKIIMHIG